jgi:hypothetical protein
MLQTPKKETSELYANDHYFFPVLTKIGLYQQNTVKFLKIRVHENLFTGFWGAL